MPFRGYGGGTCASFCVGFWSAFHHQSPRSECCIRARRVEWCCGFAPVLLWADAPVWPWAWCALMCRGGRCLGDTLSPVSTCRSYPSPRGFSCYNASLSMHRLSLMRALRRSTGGGWVAILVSLGRMPDTHLVLHLRSFCVRPLMVHNKLVSARPGAGTWLSSVLAVSVCPIVL